MPNPMRDAEGAATGRIAEARCLPRSMSGERARSWTMPPARRRQGGSRKAGRAVEAQWRDAGRYEHLPKGGSSIVSGVVDLSSRTAAARQAWRDTFLGDLPKDLPAWERDRIADERVRDRMRALAGASAAKRRHGTAVHLIQQAREALERADGLLRGPQARRPDIGTAGSDRGSVASRPGDRGR